MPSGAGLQGDVAPPVAATEAGRLGGNLCRMNGSSPARGTRGNIGIALAALAALVLVVYAPIVRHPFLVTDDPDYVSANGHVLAGLTVAGVRWAFTTFDAANWFPLTWISHMIDVQLFGVRAGAHHLVSVLLHLANTVLLYAVLRRLTGAAGRSVWVAALFALHPLHVESVAWIAERKDVLSTFFWMAALWFYGRHVRRPGLSRFVPVALCQALGLLAKPMLVTLPLTLLLLDFWPLGRLRAGAIRGPLLEKAPLALLSGISAVVTLQAQSSGGAIGSMEVFPLGARMANALVSTTVYLKKMLWPVDLAVLYPHPGTSLPAWEVWGAALLLGSATALAVYTRRRRPWLLAGWFWYLATLAPVVGLVQVGAQGMADRYTYVPLLGPFVALAWEFGGTNAGRRRVQASALLGVGVVAALAIATRLQLAYWESSIALFGHAVAVTPPNWSGQFGLGVAYEKAGHAAEAIPHYREAVLLNPRYAPGRYNLGSLLGAQGDLAGAIAELRESVRLDPLFTPAQANLGLALQLAGRVDEAIAVLRRALVRDPAEPDLHLKLAQALERRGDRDEAWRHYREAMARGDRQP